MCVNILSILVIIAATFSFFFKFSFFKFYVLIVVSFSLNFFYKIDLVGFINFVSIFLYLITANFLSFKSLNFFISIFPFAASN